MPANLELLLSSLAVAQTIPAAGLCNTGLARASPIDGCATSALVTPVNPISGGTSVDGNWQLATPYPSAPYNEKSPDPCTLSAFGPAWVDVPWPGWFNPGDGLSQYITPEVEGPVAAGGWYIYRTGVPIPRIQAGATYYVLTVAGQVLVDNQLVAIIIEDPASAKSGCKVVATPSGTYDTSWATFTFTAAVEPHSLAVLYFVTYNAEQDFGNPTGLRVEFTSAYFTPK